MPPTTKKLKKIKHLNTYEETTHCLYYTYKSVFFLFFRDYNNIGHKDHRTAPRLLQERNICYELFVYRPASQVKFIFY